jgi:hypothetical protein
LRQGLPEQNLDCGLVNVRRDRKAGKQAERVRRIAITVPRELLAAADRQARALDRSRSWVIAEAIRRFTREGSIPARGAALSQPGLGDSRRARGDAEGHGDHEARSGGAARHYVLFGASAMQLWGTTRATRDVDILIEPTVANARRVLRALSTLGFGFAKELLAEEVAKRPVTVIGDTPSVDILTVAWTVRYVEARRDAKVFEIEGVRIPTASIEHLIASKRTGHLQDAADIEVLEELRRLRGRLPG